MEGGRARPAGQVDYMLIDTADSGDLLAKLYPDAAAGNDPQLQAVYKTPRYVLVNVPANYSPTWSTTQDQIQGQPTTDQGSGGRA